MKKKFVLGVIGAGFMSTAIINGILSSKILKKSQILVSDPNDDAIRKMDKIGVKTTKDNFEVAENCNYLLFAIKPQNFDEVAILLKDIKVPTIISIMAGVKISKIKKYFNYSKVVRCMPNTPCSIGYGAVGMDISDLTDEKDIKFVNDTFSSFAKVSHVKEEEIGAVTGISGSSPAYFYYFIKAMALSGLIHGLDFDMAINLATNTMIGAGHMILANKDKTIDDLIGAVCSKGGTTIEAIKVFHDNNLDKIVDDAITACINRSKEIEDNI